MVAKRQTIESPSQFSFGEWRVSVACKTGQLHFMAARSPATKTLQVAPQRSKATEKGKQTDHGGRRSSLSSSPGARWRFILPPLASDDMYECAPEYSIAQPDSKTLSIGSV
jgi:hypothetical protein